MNRLPGREASSLAGAGMSPWCLWSVGVLMGAIAFNPWGEMLFGALGVTAEDPAWGLVLLMVTLLALSALRLLGTWRIQVGCVNARLAQRGRLVSCWLSRAASGALLGFFYGGRWTGEDSRGAIAGALVGLGIALGLGWLGAKRCAPLERMAGDAIAVLSAYCLWFWFGTWSLAALMAGHWLPGLGYGLIALLLGSLAWQGLLGLGPISSAA